MLARQLLATVLLVTSSLPALAQDELDPAVVAKIDAVFADWDKPDVPGCSVGVYQDGRVLFAKGYGAANLEHQVPNAAHTVFDLGSTSKHVTAACIALLSVEGKLSLDDEVRRHVPELPEWGERVTIRHLLHHVGGVRDYVSLILMSGRQIQDRTTDEDALAVLLRQKDLCFEPGTKQQYSNSGYFLLSRVVLGASGKTLAEFARERFFEPLGMSATHHFTDCTRVVPHRATAYAKHGKDFAIDMSDWEQTGDGAVQSTVEDMAKWVRNLETGEVGGKAWRDLMFTRAELGKAEDFPYGFGLMFGTHGGHEHVRHGGAWGGFRADLSMVPAEEFAVVVLANRADARTGQRADRVCAIVLQAVEASPVPAAARAEKEAPKMGDPAPLPTEAQLAGFAGSYVSEEAGVTWVVSIEDQRMHVTGRGAPDEGLPSSGADKFGSPDSLGLRFERDAEGRPMRFVLDLPGLEGVSFERVP
ncbi:MAG: serine hydrolase domain-containing protein [Planctomycetota bacterium]